MIVIVTEATDALSTNIEYWLLHESVEFVRINSCDGFHFLNWIMGNDANDIWFSPNKSITPFLLNQSTVWHRRAYFRPLMPESISEPDIVSFLRKEADTLFSSLMLTLAFENKVLGTYLCNKFNRLYNQRLAIHVGLKTPKTIVTTSKEHLKAFMLQNPLIVNKPIGEIFRGKVENKPKQGRVTQVTYSEIETLEENFFPMLFQEKIEKKFEIRLFVLKELFHAIAMVVPEDSEVDTRFVDESKIRLLPYNLPTDIKNKVVELMKLLDLDTASIDLIVNAKGEYYFLELNPFGMLHDRSFSNYFYTEREIATLLVNYENRKQ